MDFANPPEPFALFATWMTEAEASEPNDANAMTVSTASADGTPSARILLLRGADSRGFVFYTNSQSRKGAELLANPRVALLFHWKSLRRQVRIEGPVERIGDAEADAYFAGRPRGSQIGAWASEQSAPLASRAVLEQRIAELETRFAGQPVPRPPHWFGYRVVPRRMEFWVEREFRLHDRLVYDRAAPAAPWSTGRLYP
jgi:pyridoxamine 5'-phosphate oxidase